MLAADTIKQAEMEKKLKSVSKGNEKMKLYSRKLIKGINIL